MGICSSAKKWDECGEDSGLAELADSKITSYGMKCVLCLLQGREEIQEGRRGTESRGALTGVDQGTEPLLQDSLSHPALSHFPSAHLLSPHGHVCWPGPVSLSCSWVEGSWSR